MHFTVAVIAPTEGNSEDIVEEMLAPYSEHLDVDETAVYASDAEIRRNCLFFNISRDDIPALLSFLNYGSGSGIDEKGIWYRTTTNPQGKWDYWTVVGEESIQEQIARGHLDKVACHNLVTPDGVWHEYGSDSLSSLISSPAAKQKWAALYRKALEENKDKRLILVDCHV